MAEETVEKVKDNPAVQVAKKNLNGASGDSVMEHHSGVKFRIVPVSAGLIQSVMSKIKDPEIPMHYDEDKDREYPNPNDPIYVRQLEEAGNKRNQVSMDAMIMFGIELIDDIPNTNWERKLNFLGIEFDAKDEIEREFAFKRHILADSDIFLEIATKSGIQREQIDQAVASFPGDAA